MIHYHGLPITPECVAVEAIKAGHAFLSHRYPDQLALAIDVCQSFAVDNGAFSAWKSGQPVTDWTSFYEFVKNVRLTPSFDFAVIPDVIDGDEKANDDLVAQWPWRFSDPWVGAPVWHMHEGLLRLFRLAQEFPRICLGSSGDFATIGTPKWWIRMNQAMKTITINGYPICKLHGLRMLDPNIFTRLPLSSADSTNIARNVGIDSRWPGPYSPPGKSARAAIMRGRIEAYNSPPKWEPMPDQLCFFGQAA